MNPGSLNSEDIACPILETSIKCMRTEMVGHNIAVSGLKAYDVSMCIHIENHRDIIAGFTT